MNRKPLVSIITPSYNQGQFIEENILSIAYQDYPYIEHIVIDGGSTDNTVQVLSKYSARVKWISEPDKGFADAVNKGIRMASGEILAIQNADDRYHSPKAVSIAVAAFNNNPSVGVIFGDSAIIDQDGRIINTGQGAHRGYSFSALLCSEFIVPQASAFFSRAALEAIGGSLDMDVDWCADFDLWVRIGLKYPIIYIPEVLADYRIHPTQRNADPEYAKRNPTHRRLVLDKVFAMPNLPPEIKRLKNRAYAGTYLNQAWRLASFGHLKEAVSSLAIAVKLYPPYLFSRKMFAFLRHMFYSYLKVRLPEKQLAQLRTLRSFLRGGRTSLAPLEANNYKWWEHTR